MILDPLLLYEQEDGDKVGLDFMEQKLQVQEIALMCTKKPADRPTMRDVENMLQAVSKPVEKNEEGWNPLVGLAIAKGNEDGDQV